MVIFVCIALFGLAVLMVSAFMGGHEFEHEIAVDHEIAGDHEVEGHAEHESGQQGPSIFSVRIISLFMTGFGAAGAISQHYQHSYPVSILFGVIAGLIMGYLGFQFLCMIYKQQASSTVTSEDLVGLKVEVKTAIPKEGIGQVCAEVKGQRLYLSARSKTGFPIAEGSIVTITENLGSNVTVE